MKKLYAQNSLKCKINIKNSFLEILTFREGESSWLGQNPKILTFTENNFWRLPLSKVSDQESMKRLKRLMTIMDSMNDKVIIQHDTFITIWTWLGTWRHGCFQDLHQAANKSIQNCLWGWCHGDGGDYFKDPFESHFDSEYIFICQKRLTLFPGACPARPVQEVQWGGKADGGR